MLVVAHVTEQPERTRCGKPKACKDSHMLLPVDDPSNCSYATYSLAFGPDMKERLRQS